MVLVLWWWWWCHHHHHCYLRIFFDTSLKILTPALQVVQVTNMRYGFILALSQKLNLENLLFNNIDTNVFV